MTTSWIILSTRWGLSSVQAALNVVISVLGTVGIWSFSRFWWQRGCFKILDMKNNGNVPLSRLFAFTTPGEGWDLVAVQRKQVFARENWHLLFQLIVVILVSAATILSGPIAQVSLKTGRTVNQQELQVLQTMKGGGYFGNLLYANVLWNDTIQSLNDADFPTNQLLDYVPPSTEPWTYVANEWDPTWIMSCDGTPETTLSNIVASGKGNIYDPLDAFPAFRDTYDSSWFSPSYRINNNFDSWQTWTDKDQLKHVFFFVVIQSDPVIHDRMYTNNGTLQISISLFHAQDFAVNYTDPQISGETTWRPVGPVSHASYTRTECNITRTSRPVTDENKIPWVWTNDTYSIAMGYRTYWEYALEATAGRSLQVPTLSAKDLLRFYQAYMAATNTNHALPTSRKVSIWVNTVELSIVFLTVVILLAVLTAWNSARYFIFLRRHKSEIEQTFVPDGKIDWMIHAAKAAAEEELMKSNKLKDRDHFRMASFGFGELHVNSDPEVSGAELQMPKLARVSTSLGSESGKLPPLGLGRVRAPGRSIYGRSQSTDNSVSSQELSSQRKCNRLSSLVELDDNDEETSRDSSHKLKYVTSPLSSVGKEPEDVVSATQNPGEDFPSVQPLEPATITTEENFLDSGTTKNPPSMSSSSISSKCHSSSHTEDRYSSDTSARCESEMTTLPPKHSAVDFYNQYPIIP